MGCAGAKPAQKKTFAEAIVVRPYGVLGEAAVPGGRPWETKPAGPPPDADIVIVDPASLNVAKGDPYFAPGDAGGAARAIYRFLGIEENASFPPDVVSQLNAPCDAVYKRYGFPDAKHVIHVVGPDFKVCARRSGPDAALAPGGTGGSLC